MTPRLKKLRILFVLLGLGMLAVVSMIFGMMAAISQDLPAIYDFAQYKASKNSEVLDDNGEVIGTLTSDQNKILLSSGQISPNVKNAVVSIEDARFYEHNGVDFRGIARALVSDIASGSAQQGASTITEQFVKNALEAEGSRTVLEKFREAALAYRLEKHWSKEKILTEYLNTIYFGEGAYGIEAAARTYFGAAHPGCGTPTEPCASVLDPWEAALLAGIIASPSAFDPKVYPENALGRRNLVLEKMYEHGY
ncbi:MAG TPA: biosynthetic peptidoglycan transglycosylase, partial [Solirubrobacterales bacterium]